MSRKYKFQNPEGMYFVSFAVVYWIDLFVRDCYFSILLDALKYNRKHKGLEVFCWCIMPSHVHLIIRSLSSSPEVILGRFKEYTSKQLQQEILNNPEESRKEWLLWMMKRAGEKSSNVKGNQLWQHHNKPIELWSEAVIDQKVAYIHENPVVSGFVNNPEDWRYSSAIDYSGGKGLLEMDFIE